MEQSAECATVQPIRASHSSDMWRVRTDAPSETRMYPFPGNEVRAVMARLEEEADEMWHEWNNDSDDDEV